MGEKLHLSFTQAGYQKFRANVYRNTQLNALSMADVLWTYGFRYPKLEADINHSPDSQGDTINYTATHPEAAIVTTLALGVVSIGYAVDEYKACQAQRLVTEKRLRDSYLTIMDRLKSNAGGVEISRTVVEPSVSQREDSLSQPSINYEILNRELEQLRLRKFAQKYKKIEIDEDGEVHVELVDEPPLTTSQKIVKRLASFAKTSWRALFLASFAYWILWIGAGVFTGNFASPGIPGMGAAGYVIPLSIGIIYPLIKLKNWIKKKLNKNSGKAYEYTSPNEGVSDEVKDDVISMLNLVELEQEKKYLRSQLKNSIALKKYSPAYHPSLTVLQSHKTKKVAIEFATQTVASFISAQYNLWLLTDIVTACGYAIGQTAMYTLGLGSVVIAGSVVYGAYKAYQCHKEIKKYEQEAKQFVHREESLQQIFADKLKQINTLSLKMQRKARGSDLDWINQQMNSVEKQCHKFMMANDVVIVGPAPTWKEKIKGFFKDSFLFLSAGTTGAMIGRVLTVTGTVACIPFVALGLSNPFTVGIIVGLGIIYACVKLYQRHQAKKVTNALSDLKKHQKQEEIAAQQIEWADLQLQALKEKNLEIDSKEFNEKFPSPTPTVTKDADYVAGSPRSVSLFSPKYKDDSVLHYSYPTQLKVA